MDHSSIPEEFTKIITMIRNNMGKTLLNDDDIMFLLADEVIRSFTRDEKDMTKTESMS